MNVILSIMSLFAIKGPLPVSSVLEYPVQNESRLIRDLMMNYNVLARPVLDPMRILNVTLGIVLQQLIDVIRFIFLDCVCLLYRIQTPSNVGQGQFFSQNTDEKNEKIETNIWLKLMWTDELLKWDPADYGGISELRLPPDMVWKPDVLLYNSVDRGFYTFHQPKVTFDYNGSMLWVPPEPKCTINIYDRLRHWLLHSLVIIQIAAIVKTACNIDIVWFPFDCQTCDLKFGCWTYGSDFVWLRLGIIDLDTYIENSEWLLTGIVKTACNIDIVWFPFDSQQCDLKFGCWTYGGEFVALRDGPIDLDTYMENGEWTLLDVKGRSNMLQYDCCEGKYYDVTFTVMLRRRTLYYGFNLLIPCVLITLMALLDFILPPDSGEKLTLGITVFMCLFVFLLMIAEATPPTSDGLPLIGITVFMCLCVFLLMVAESMPPTSDALPLIGVYFSTIMIIISLSQVFTVLCLNFHHRNAEFQEMPIVIKKIFLDWLPVILVMRRPDVLFKQTKGGYSILTNPKDSESFKSRHETFKYIDDNVLQRIHAYNSGLRRSFRPTLLTSNNHVGNSTSQPMSDGQSKRRERGRSRGSAPPGEYSTHVGHPMHHSNPRLNSLNHSPLPKNRTPKSIINLTPCGTKVKHANELLLALSNLELMISGLLREVQFITHKMEKDEQDKQVSRQWKYAAMVLDRLCLYIFICALGIATCGIIFSAEKIAVY